MAMQQSGKGAGEGNAPNLSDEQAEQFAASFTPAWDADDGLGDDTNGTANATLVDAPAAAAVAVAAAVAANAPVRGAVQSSEAIDPENILESNTAPQPAIAVSPAVAQPAAAHANPLMKTQLMPQAPGPVAAPARAQAKAAPAATAPSAARNGPQNAPRAAVAVSADPFKRADDDDDIVPKKSKTLIFVIGGLAVAAGIGLVAKFAMSDDAPKAPTTQQAVGPAVATAEIPPPPPKVETPPPTAAAATTATIAAARPPEPLAAPTALAAPTTPSRPTEPAPHAAPAAMPRQPRAPAATPPQAAAAPLPPAAPKTPPKGQNTGIVRDNPF